MKKPRKYDDEFKRDAVALVISSGKSVNEVSRELGIPNTCLSRWKRDHFETLDGGTEGARVERLPSEIEKENRQLRRELAEIKQQREILKKAVGIFSRDPDKYMDS
jgi:transposase